MLHTVQAAHTKIEIYDLIQKVVLIDGRSAVTTTKW